MSEAVGHLSDSELDAFLTRAASASGLTDAGRHLAECPQCRARAEERAIVKDGFAALFRQVALSLPEGHLSAEDVQVLAQGGLLPNAANHIKGCDSCRAEVDDLKQFIAARRRPQPFRAQYWIGIAALILAAISIVAWRATHSGPQMPSAYAALTAQARSSGRLEVSPAVAALYHLGPEQLLGEPDKPTGFVLLGPLREAIITDRPTFSWSPAPGATSYRVNVYDENFGKIAESPQLAVPSWTPAQPLGGARTYSWTVTARVGQDDIRQPIPPAPEARFKILSAPEVEQLHDAARKYPNDHLLLAALFAQAGAIQEARRELKLLAAAEPDSDLPRRLENSLDGRQ